MAVIQFNKPNVLNFPSLLGTKVMLTFTDGSRIQTSRVNVILVNYYRVSYVNSLGVTIASLSVDLSGLLPIAWATSSYNFNGKVIAETNDTSILKIIKK